MLIKDLVPNTGTEQEETNFTVRGLSVNSLSFEINVFTVFVFSNKVFIYTTSKTYLNPGFAWNRYWRTEKS